MVPQERSGVHETQPKILSCHKYQAIKTTYLTLVSKQRAIYIIYNDGQTVSDMNNIYSHLSIEEKLTFEKQFLSRSFICCSRIDTVRSMLTEARGP